MLKVILGFSSLFFCVLWVVYLINILHINNTFGWYHHTIEVESMEQRKCEFKKAFPGKCGKNGIFTCFTDIQQMPNPPKNIKITPIANYRCSDIPLSPDRMCIYVYACWCVLLNIVKSFWCLPYRLMFLQIILLLIFNKSIIHG